MVTRSVALPSQFVIRLLLSTVAGFLLPRAVAAQVMQPMCVSGCLPNYAVSVTPDGVATPDLSATTGGYMATFSICNGGQLGDTYSLSCSATGPVTCDGLSTTSITVPSKGTYKSLKVWYSVGNPGTGVLTLHANGEASDVGSYAVHVVTPPASPIVLLKPWNGAVRDLSACVNACFEKVVTHATPAYISMDVPRSFGLTYASGSARPTPVVWVDVLRPSGATSLTIGLQRVATGGNLLNGSTSAWYAVSGDTVRMAGWANRRHEVRRGMPGKSPWAIASILGLQSFPDHVNDIAAMEAGYMYVRNGCKGN